MKSETIITVGSALATGLVALACVPERGPSTAVRVDSVTAEQVVGGVSADVQWPSGSPWYQSYDNLRFDIDIDNGFGTNSASVQAYADNTKAGYANVATPGPSHTGNWHARMDWPVPGQKDLQVKYVYDGKTYNASGNSSLPNQYLHPTVKVHTVKFWNAQSPSMSTFVSSGITRGLVDSYNASIPTRTTNVDGIYAENCGTLTKTQWRFAGVGTMQISDACMDMVASGSTYTACLDEFNDNYKNDTANVHVVFIKRNSKSGHAGAHMKSGSRYSITIRDDWAGNSDLDALLAHELGHTYVGGHVSSASGNCSASRANRNLMCSSVGRIMTNTQCDTAMNSGRYTDRN